MEDITIKSHYERGIVRFLGEYSYLKNMGYEFQKLYAGNCMTWKKGHLTVYKRDREIMCNDEYDLYKLVQFLLQRPLIQFSSFRGDTEYATFYKIAKTPEDSRVWSYEEHNKENRDILDAYLEDLQDVRDNGNAVSASSKVRFATTITVKKELIDDLHELEKMGWIEPEQRPDEEFLW